MCVFVRRTLASPQFDSFKFDLNWLLTFIDGNRTRQLGLRELKRRELLTMACPSLLKLEPVHAKNSLHLSSTFSKTRWMTLNHEQILVYYNGFVFQFIRSESFVNLILLLCEF